MLGETIELAGFEVGQLYSRAEIARIGGVSPPTGSLGGTWSSGIERFDNAVLLMVTLEKRHYTYRDYFDGSLFWWQSQKEQTQESPVIVQLIHGELPSYLFVRLRDKTKKSKAEPFVYAGRLSQPEVQGERPVTALFALLDFVLTPSGALAEVYDWKPVDMVSDSAEFLRHQEIALRRATGQGRQADVATRKAVEMHAMALATAYYVADGWEVSDTSKNNPFDLVCTKGDALRRVEVKGTQSVGAKVEVTIGEINAARQLGVDTDLYIVHSILVSKVGQERIASGGFERVIAPWRPSDSALAPMVFSYCVPEE